MILKMPLKWLLFSGGDFHRITLYFGIYCLFYIFSQDFIIACYFEMGTKNSQDLHCSLNFVVIVFHI